MDRLPLASAALAPFPPDFPPALAPAAGLDSFLGGIFFLNFDAQRSRIIFDESEQQQPIKWGYVCDVTANEKDQNKLFKIYPTTNFPFQ